MILTQNRELFWKDAILVRLGLCDDAACCVYFADDSGLRTGAIVGIVIACLAGVTLLMLIIIYCIRKQ